MTDTQLFALIGFGAVIVPLSLMMMPRRRWLRGEAPASAGNALTMLMAFLAGSAVGSATNESGVERGGDNGNGISDFGGDGGSGDGGGD